MTSALVVYSRMIKLSHSIFALPFALASGVLASRALAAQGLSTTPAQWAWIVVCMVTARASAMGFNRIVDRDIDAANPRTADRELPSGAISLRAAWAFTLGSASAFVGASAMLGLTTLALSPVALVVLWGYSLTKRFTAWCHGVLGLALGLAPVAVWIALTDTLAWPAVVLGVAVATWVAGFDIIYSCQDAAFDSGAGLHSVPSTLGIAGALRLSSGLHAVTAVCLVSLPAMVSLGVAYWLGVAVVLGVLIWEHAIVSADDLSRVNKAFFDLNGYISLVFLAAVLAA